MAEMFLSPGSQIQIADADDTSVHEREASDTGCDQQVQRHWKLSLLEVETSESDDNVYDEVQRYQAEPQISVNADALLWWKEHSACFPQLSQVAKKYLSTPATTIPCERLFSVAGEIVNKKRALLLPEMRTNSSLCQTD